MLGNDHSQLFFSCPRAQQWPSSGASAKMATALIIWVRRRLHAERCGQFRLFPINTHMSQTETLRREDWSVFVFLQGLVLTFSQHSRWVQRSCLPAGWLVFVGMRAPTTFSTSPQVMSPRPMTINELQNSSVPLSFKIPIADQDVDDLTLGEMLTEAYRGQVDYFVQEGVSVSQSSSSVVFDRAGKLAGERDVDQSNGFGVTRNTYSAHSKFSENTQAEKVVDRSGKLEERAQMHRLGLYLKNRDR